MQEKLQKKKIYLHNSKKSGNFAPDLHGILVYVVKKVIARG